MNQVYLLLHSTEEFGIGDDKILGIYSKRELAEEAKQRYMQLKGFCDYPLHCFFVQPYTVDKDDKMCEGFFRWGDSEAYHEAFISMTETMNSWLGIRKSVKDSWEDKDYYEVLREISWKIRHTETTQELGAYMHDILVSCAGIFSPLDECIEIAEKLLKQE